MLQLRVRFFCHYHIICQPMFEFSVNNCADIIQQYLLPTSCILCAQPGHGAMDICNSCLLSLPKNQHSCYCCGLPLEQEIPVTALCGSCISALPAFSNTVAPYLYLHSMRYLVQQLKFNTRYELARLLGQLLADHLLADPGLEIPELLIPVPLHPARYRLRGFNQAQEIARTIARQTNIPLNYSCCVREKNTLQQVNLTAKKRQKNLRRAFRVTSPILVRHVAIIDDVMTTGATVNELAKSLSQAGVERIDVWVCARA